MAPPVTPRVAWIDAALRALAAGGPDAVRIEALARALGVSKGGFYWYFTDREALLTELLDTWERTSVDDVVQLVESKGGDARARLRRLFGLASASPDILPTDLAVRDWARRDRAVARRLKRADNRRMSYLRSLFSAFCSDANDVEVRSLMSFSLWIGNHFVAADHGTLTRAEVLALAFERLRA